MLSGASGHKCRDANAHSLTFSKVNNICHEHQSDGVLASWGGEVLLSNEHRHRRRLANSCAVVLENRWCDGDRGRAEYGAFGGNLRKLADLDKETTCTGHDSR